MKVKSYKELLIWQKAMEIIKETYILVHSLPKEETYALSDQMRRSAVSIASNIAEGQERNSTPDFLRFLHIAQGSRAELETQITVGRMIGYFNNDDTAPLLDKLSELGKMTNSLISNIQANKVVNN